MMGSQLYDYKRLQRRRINANPSHSLEVYRQLKSEDEFDLGVTVQALAARLVSISIAERNAKEGQ